MNFLKILPYLLLLLLTACGADGPSPDAVALGVAPTKDEPATLSTDTIEKDAIEATVDRTPESMTADERKKAGNDKNSATVASSEKPAPAPRRPKKPSVAPPPPTNTNPMPSKPEPTVEPIVEIHVDHSAFDALLQQHVNATGEVNYAGFKRDRGKLEAYLTTLSAQVPAKDWSRNESLAYWINAYNAFTIKLIVDNYPLESIRDLDEPWDRKWIKLAGSTYSLNNIEHDLIRPRFQEPRIHFALVCAAQSCPPLANRAYTAANLNSMLESRTRNFLRNERYNVTQEENVRVSPLFDWYGEDFGDIRTYLNKYLKRDIPQGVEINFLSYDWSLNSQK